MDKLLKGWTLAKIRRSLGALRVVAETLWAQARAPLQGIIYYVGLDE